MLWPIVLPFKITFWVLTSIVIVATLLSPALKWKSGKTFCVVSLLSLLAFVPSCTGIMAVIDTQRFGMFQYDEFSDVNDLRIQRYLPPKAKRITLEKYAAGHRAKYSITESELNDFLDRLWSQYGQRSAIPRDELDDGKVVTADAYDYEFAELDWPISDAIRYHSPVQSDGGGATYYFHRSTGKVYHRAGYW